jgi:hypothetical protein
MTGHRFNIGQLVRFYPKKVRRVSIDTVSGLYQIVKRHPPADDGGGIEVLFCDPPDVSGVCSRGAWSSALKPQCPGS